MGYKNVSVIVVHSIVANVIQSQFDESWKECENLGHDRTSSMTMSRAKSSEHLSLQQSCVGNGRKHSKEERDSDIGRKLVTSCFETAVAAGVLAETRQHLDSRANQEKANQVESNKIDKFYEEKESENASATDDAPAFVFSLASVPAVKAYDPSKFADPSKEFNIIPDDESSLTSLGSLGEDFEKKK